MVRGLKEQMSINLKNKELPNGQRIYQVTTSTKSICKDLTCCPETLENLASRSGQQALVFQSRNAALAFEAEQRKEIENGECFSQKEKDEEHSQMED